MIYLLLYLGIGAFLSVLSTMIYRMKENSDPVEIAFIATLIFLAWPIACLLFFFVFLSSYKNNRSKQKGEI